MNKNKSVVFFMSVASTASNFVAERRLGLTERSFLAGMISNKLFNLKALQE